MVFIYFSLVWILPLVCNLQSAFYARSSFYPWSAGSLQSAFYTDWFNFPSHRKWKARITSWIFNSANQRFASKIWTQTFDLQSHAGRLKFSALRALCLALCADFGEFRGACLQANKWIKICTKHFIRCKLFITFYGFFLVYSLWYITVKHSACCKKAAKCTLLSNENCNLKKKIAGDKLSLNKTKTNKRNGQVGAGEGKNGEAREQRLQAERALSDSRRNFVWITQLEVELNHTVAYTIHKIVNRLAFERYIHLNHAQ